MPIPPGGTLGDYVPFYFTPHSPMMLNIKTGRGVARLPNEELVVIVSSLITLANLGIPFVFTDRHAYLANAEFYDDLAWLDRIDWDILRRRDFRRDPDDPGKFERYQAEALAHRHVPTNALIAIGCYNGQVESRLKEMIAERGLGIRTVIREGWYF